MKLLKKVSNKEKQIHFRPKIFIGITTYNNVENIENIKKVAASGYDYLVVDDFSTDGLVKKLLANNIKFLQPEKKVGGPGKSRNIIIQNALKSDANFITFLDGDDELNFNELAKVVDAIDINDEYVATQMLTENNDVFLRTINASWNFQGRVDKDSLLKQEEYRKIFNSNGGRIYNLNFIEKYNLKYIDDQPGQDTLFNLMCLNHAQQFFINNNNFFYIRKIYDDSLSNNFNIDSLKKRYKTHSEIGITTSNVKFFQRQHALSKINNLNATLFEKEELYNIVLNHYENKDEFSFKARDNQKDKDIEVNNDYERNFDQKLGIITYHTNENVINSFKDNEDIEIITYSSISKLIESLYKTIVEKNIDNVVYFSADLKQKLNENVVEEYVQNKNTNKIVIPYLKDSKFNDVYNVHQNTIKNEYSLFELGLNSIDGIVLPNEIFKYKLQLNESLFESNIAIVLTDYGRVEYNLKLVIDSKLSYYSKYKLSNYLIGNRRINVISFDMLCLDKNQYFFYRKDNFDFKKLIGFKEFTQNEKDLISYSIDNTKLNNGFYVVNKFNEVISIYLKDNSIKEIDFEKMICLPIQREVKYQIFALLDDYQLVNVKNVIQGDVSPKYHNESLLNHFLGSYYNVERVAVENSWTKVGSLCMSHMWLQFVYNKNDFIIGSKFLVSLNHKNKLLQSIDYVTLNPAHYTFKKNKFFEMVFVDENQNVIHIGQINKFVKVKVIIITNGKFKIKNKNLLIVKRDFSLTISRETLLKNGQHVYNSSNWAYCLSDEELLTGTTLIKSSDVLGFTNAYNINKQIMSYKPIIFSTSMLNHKTQILHYLLRKVEKFRMNRKVSIGLLVDDYAYLNTNIKIFDFDFYIHSKPKTCNVKEYILTNENDMLRLKAKYEINQPILIKAKIETQMDINRIILFLETQENRSSDNFLIENLAQAEEQLNIKSNLINVNFIDSAVNCNPKYTLDISTDFEYGKDTLFNVENIMALNNNQEFDLTSSENININNIKAVKYNGSSIAILTRSFITSEDLYSNKYVYNRICKYKEDGTNVVVYTKTLNEYVYDGIKVMPLSMLEAQNQKSLTFTNIHIHSLQHYLLIGTTLGVPVTLFSHGVDIFSYHTREHNAHDFDTHSILRLMRNDVENQENYIRAFNNTNGRCEIVFCSNWLQNEFMNKTKLNIIPTRVVNNHIDCDFFEYIEKDFTKIKFLTIKSFSNHNYANDILVDTIYYLSETYDKFNEMEFTIVGDGKLFEKQTSKIKDFKNVKLEQRFLTSLEIKEYHKNHNVGIYITRADTQGISRLESMASGLLTISTAVQGIPEFSSKLSHLINENTVEYLSQKLIDVFENKENHLLTTKEDRKFVVDKLSLNNTVRKDCDYLI